jgi:HK97 gp10 family phage protein
MRAGPKKYCWAMAGELTVELKGVDGVLNKLKAYANGTRTRVENVIAETLLTIEADAKELAPVDTGLLRSSIHSNLQGSFKGTVSVNVDYAIHIEYGTVKTPAQPFLIPAYQKNKDEFLKALKEALKYRR